MSGEATGFVFARGGSKGVKDKNLRTVGAKSLVALAVEHALAAQTIGRVIISTDSEEIAREARAAGAEAPFMRPPELATDESPEWLAWRHALEEIEKGGEKVATFVSISPTAPLRAPEDINACVERLARGDADVVITVTPARRSPHFNMVSLNGDGMASLLMPPERAIDRRQNAPAVFDMTTVCYAVRPEYLMRAAGMMAGRVAAVLVPAARALDIDSELDLKIAEALITGG
jgi:N-acylneuraminate cytidylyltransferase